IRLDARTAAFRFLRVPAHAVALRRRRSRPGRAHAQRHSDLAVADAPDPTRTCRHAHPGAGICNFPCPLMKTPTLPTRTSVTALTALIMAAGSKAAAPATAPADGGDEPTVLPGIEVQAQKN